jgi:hypothetical protein
MEYLIVLFKDKKRKKIINKFKTLDRAKDFYNNKLDQSSKVIFEKKVENASPCDYELGLLSKKNNEFNSLFVKDNLGRQVKVDLDDDDYKIIQISKYNVEEKIFDLTSNTKITTTEFLKKFLRVGPLKMVSKLNNKVVLQNDDTINLFSLKDSDECTRFLDSISFYLIDNGRSDVIVVSESSSAQKKYLYDILHNMGFDKKILYRTTTTFKPRK